MQPARSIMDWALVFIGESKRNMVIRQGELGNPTHGSRPAKHSNKNIQHSYYWKILANASKHTRKRKNLEVTKNNFLKVYF